MNKESHQYWFFGAVVFFFSARLCYNWLSLCFDKVTNSRYDVCSSPIRWIIRTKKPLIHVQGTSSRPMHMIAFLRRSNICSWLCFSPTHSGVFSGVHPRKSIAKKCHLHAWWFEKEFSGQYRTISAPKKMCHVKIKFIINFPSFLFYHYMLNVIKWNKKRNFETAGRPALRHTQTLMYRIVRKPNQTNIPPSERFISIQCAIWHVWCVICNLTEEYLCFFVCFLFENFQYPSPMSTCYENSGECVVYIIILFVYKSTCTMWVRIFFN